MTSSSEILADDAVIWSSQSASYDVDRPLNFREDTTYPGVKFKRTHVDGQKLILRQYCDVEVLWYNYGIYVLDQFGNPIKELCYLFGEYPTIEALKQIPVIDLPGITTSIMHWVPGNYCHILYEHLPLLQALEEANQLDRSDRILCDKWAVKFISNLQSIYKIGAEIFGVETTGRVRCETLLAFEPVRHPAHWGHQVMCRFFDRVRQESRPALPHRRLIVTRPVGRRGFTNLAELKAALPEFEIIDFENPNSLYDQARIFAEAELIICGHGAALTNLVFMQPSTSVIEIFNKNYGMASFWLPAAARRLRYFATIDPHGAGEYRDEGKTEDMTIDIAAVLECVKMAAG